MFKSRNTGFTNKSDQDDKAVVNAMLKKANKNQTKKPRLYLRDPSAPKPPNSGYVRFLNDRRVQLSSENHNLSFSEITRVLAAEWNQLPSDKKQPYILAAEQERVKYLEELAAYKKTDTYRKFIIGKLKKKELFSAIQNDQELNKEKPPTENKVKKDQELNKEKPPTENKVKKDQKLKKENTSSENSDAAHDIPIFTEEFLNFNKARETELRNLRKNVTDQEQEVCVLDKHIENMLDGTTKLKAYTEKLEARYSKYEQYLNKLRSILLDAFANTEFMDDTEVPTYETIDAYMVNLFTGLKNGTDTDSSKIAKVIKAISYLDSSQYPTEDDNKYEIIEEILDKLEQKNPISSLKENHNKEFPQLFQKATKACSNTKVLQKHVECNISNTTNEEQIHQLVQEAAQECSNLDMSNMQINEELIESNTIEKEDLLQLTEKVAQKCSNLKGPYVNDNSSASTTTDEKNVPVDTRSSQGM
ncbi:high mobility group protein 20A-like [Melanaphis sacchari]|uniref:high mobility group protein 20A-like n=1 Tax=Melanaphis sacchari TaxID=742174 RepID=UPI000DC14261|nr:high mobility group protein 20A-like [Melanaphis sacchari]